MNLDSMTYEEFKVYMLTKLQEFEDQSWKQEDMQTFMKGEETVPLGDWFEWFGCQSKLM